MKTCKKCLKNKPLDEFYAYKRSADGLTYRCKSCLLEDTSEWQRKNPDKVRGYKRKWARANPEKNLGDREKSRERHRRAYRKNPETAAKAVRVRRARKLGVEYVPYTTEDILALWGTACHICGEEVDLDAPRRMGRVGWERGLHLDHVVPLVAGGADAPKNVKPAHGRCNVDKSAGQE